MKPPTSAPQPLAGYTEIPIAEFDSLARSKAFKDGPFVDSFGDGYGDPYHPRRAVWGTLRDGRQVRATKG